MCYFYSFRILVYTFVISSRKVNILFKKMKNRRIIHRWIDLVVLFWNFNYIILLLQLINRLIFFFILIFFQNRVFVRVFFGLNGIIKMHACPWLFTHLSIVHINKCLFHVLLSSLNVAHSQRGFVIWTKIARVYFLGVHKVIRTIYYYKPSFLV